MIGITQQTNKQKRNHCPWFMTQSLACDAKKNRETVTVENFKEICIRGGVTCYECCVITRVEMQYFLSWFTWPFFAVGHYLLQSYLSWTNDHCRQKKERKKHSGEAKYICYGIWSCTSKNSALVTSTGWGLISQVHTKPCRPESTISPPDQCTNLRSCIPELKIKSKHGWADRTGAPPPSNKDFCPHHILAKMIPKKAFKPPLSSSSQGSPPKHSTAVRLCCKTSLTSNPIRTIQCEAYERYFSSKFRKLMKDNSIPKLDLNSYRKDKQRNVCHDSMWSWLTGK